MNIHFGANRMNRVQIIAGAAFLTVLTAGGAAVAVAQSTDAAPAAGTCQVTVDRSQAADSFRVDRQTLQNGDCVCYVYTGPSTQGASTESQVADVLNRRDCGAAAAPVGETAAATGGGSNVPLIVAGGIGVAGGIVALTNSDGHNDSPGG